MGWLQKIGKGIKNILTGAGKLLKKAYTSKLGKALLLGAAIYVGYGLATQGTAFFGGGAAATAGAPATMAESVAGLQAQVAAGGTGVSAIAPTAVAAAPTIAAGAPATMAESVAGLQTQAAGAGIAPIVDTSSKMPGLLSKAGDALVKTGQFIEKNPMASYGMMNVGGRMISGAFAPDPVEEQLRLERERAETGRIAGYGGPRGGAPLRVGSRTYT